MEIDVLLRTKNSLTNSPFFYQVIMRALKVLPMHRLLCVDCYSQDGTIELLQTCLQPMIYRSNGNRAVASQLGIEQVNTDWLMFLDDDVLLPWSWWRRAQSYLKDPEIGLVWGYPRIINPHSRNRFRMMQLLTRKSEWELHRKNFQFRGGLHDTLIRREALKGIQIPYDLHHYEDKYIKETVEANGYKAIAPPELFCYHWLSVDFNKQTTQELGQLAKKYGFYTTKKILFRLFMAIPKSLAILLFTGDWTATKDQLQYYVGESLSFLRSKT